MSDAPAAPKTSTSRKFVPSRKILVGVTAALIAVGSFAVINKLDTNAAETENSDATPAND